MYPKRLIEVDLPIARISAHARREKSIRHGHISTLHIWWARRPLAACRAVICASLWPDPVDKLCPQAFREAAVEQIKAFSRRVFPDKISEEGRMLSSEKHSSPESRARWEAIAQGTLTLNAKASVDLPILRLCLLDFIADFANWDNSTVPAFLETSRALTQAAHESLGGIPGTRPLVVDSFCGGGSIPLEALRVGADAFASDLNPVPVLLNKVVLEYIPKYGKRLADEVRKWGEWIKCEAEKELAEFYPKDPDGATPIAYLWARTIRCEGPGCGAEVPLIRSPWLAKKANRSVALRLIPNPQEKRVDFDIVMKQRDGWVSQSDLKTPIANPSFDGTVKRGSATCPCCAYTTPVEQVRTQLRARKGGTSDAKLYCKVVTTTDGATDYRASSACDSDAITAAIRRLGEVEQTGMKLPAMPLPPDGALGFRVQKYGISQWAELFLDRQKLQLLSYLKIARDVPVDEPELQSVLALLFALTVSKLSSFSSSLCVWRNVRTCVAQTFGRQTLSMVWDFGEMNPFAQSAGDFGEAIEYLAEFIEHVASTTNEVGTVQEADATKSPLADDCCDFFFTDPPYYDAIPYHHLSGFFVFWLNAAGLIKWNAEESKRQRDAECIVDEGLGKTNQFFENTMSAAMREGRRMAKPSALGVLVFAHKSTAGWEAQLSAMLGAGWTVTSSWPIDTERSGRLRAQDSAALASSIHITCRPREDASGAETDAVGEWRDVLGELPKRIHEWMPRLAAEGVVGADAIFACLGPALEIYSRYSRVEKSNGETATLREYLEFVWGAVSSEALALIFKDADAAGLEPDARLTAMWLWTLGGGKSEGEKGRGGDKETDEDAGEEDEDAPAKSGKLTSGFMLEYDAARKIAQGLGVHLEQCQSLVEVKGDKARLLPVAERTQFLFGKDTQTASSGGRRKKKIKQQTLFAELGEAEAAESGWTDLKGPPPGSTTLDRVHQAMILFAANRGELLKRFLVDDGVGKDSRFWKLADNLNKLYPAGTEERRWVEGVLARKKGLGL